jgi:endonuclease/exonuclease/phosphatase family metal-dependent hydrolase
LPLTPNWTPLLGGERLSRQQALIAGVLPDVLGLQELHDCSIGDAYVAAFPSHALVRTQRCNWAGASTLALLAALALGGLFALAASAGLLAAAAVAAACALLLRSDSFAVPLQFLTGRTQGGLGLLLRRGRVAVRAAATRIFAKQAGDVLNLLKPRGYQAVLVELMGGGGGGAAAGAPPQVVLLLHTHANLGRGPLGEHLRRRQLRELAAAAEPPAIAGLLALAGLAGAVAPEAVPVVCLGDFNAAWGSSCLQGALAPTLSDAWGAAADGERTPTWDNEGNRLCRGVLREPTARVDLVLYGAPRDAAAGLALLPVAAAVVVDDGAAPCSDHYLASVVFRVEPPGASATAAEAAARLLEKAGVAGGAQGGRSSRCSTGSSVRSEVPGSPRDDTWEEDEPSSFIGDPVEGPASP